MLVGLSGFARTGKDSAASYLVRERRYERRAFADEVRAFLYDINPFVVISQELGDEVVHYHEPLRDLVDKRGWDDAKAEPNVRALLQRVGETMRQRVGENVWRDMALSSVRSYGNYVLTDCRFPNEADSIRGLGGHVIRIERPGYGPINNHISETALTDYGYFSAVVDNDGTLDELGDKILRVVKELTG